VRTMEWQPSEELIDWGKEHFANMTVNSIWSPDDSGVTFKKTDEKTFALIYRMNHPVSETHYERLKILLDACDYVVEEPDDVEIVTPPLNPQAQANMEFERRQDIAKAWVCECGFPLANNELENNTAEYVETVEAETDTKETVPIDLWRYKINCAQCNEEISIDPDDFHLLAGDNLFMQWTSSTHNYVALTRMQLKDFADNGLFDLTDDGGYPEFITVLGQKKNDESVPPWMWGLSVMANKNVILKEEEEEE